MVSQELNTRIVIEEPTTTLSASGASTKTWATKATVWASALYRGGREFAAASQVHAEADVVWKIRHRSDITTMMRVAYGARYYDIVAVDDVSDKTRTLLVCREGKRLGS